MLALIKGYIVLSTKNTMKLLRTTMLSFMVSFNSSVTTDGNAFTANIECQILLKL